MKKTRLIIIISIVAVVFVGIAIWGIIYSSGQNTNYVEEIVFTNTNGTVNYPDEHVLEFNYSTNSKTHQLTYQVLPKKADNKDLKFSSDSENVTVSSTGLVTYIRYNNVTTITAESTDGSLKTRKIKLHASYVGSIPINFDFASGIFSSNETELMTFSEDDGLILYMLDTNNTYTLNASGVVFTIESGTDVASISSNILTILKNSSFKIKATSGGSSNTFDVSIDEFRSVNIGAAFVGKSSENYIVGSHNAFILPFAIAGSNGLPLTLATTGTLEFAVKNGSSYSEYANVSTGATYVSLDPSAMKVLFTESSVGLSFKLKVSASGKSAEFNFTVKDVSNILTDADFKAACADKTSYGVAFHDNITAAAHAGTIVSYKGKDYILDNPYAEDHIYNIKFPNDVTFYEIAGNGRNLDAAALPTLITKNDGGAYIDPTAEEYFISHDNGLIAFSGTKLLDSISIHNLNIKGNAQTSDRGELSGSFSLINLGCFGQMLGDVVVKDAVLTGGLTGIISDFASSLLLDNVKISDTFSHSLNLYNGNTTLNNCVLRKSGGPLIHLYSYSDHARLTISGTFVAENWMVGTSRWIVKNFSGTSAVTALKTSVNNGIKSATGNQLAILANDTGANEYFNFILYAGYNNESIYATGWTINCSGLSGNTSETLGPVYGYSPVTLGPSSSDSNEYMSVNSTPVPHYLLVNTSALGTRVLIMTECIVNGTPLSTVDQTNVF